ncbi:hypothetical protein [Gilliamella sp. GillExp13]|uniref:hypothetical protein n=1 Tax=Gilliamella sp. GillExp13 TaxID=3120243 RepID=UPI00080E6E8A|nr:hypothetical protein [Gilliamella apicola]OCG61059.1 hypothetical protein A9G37_02440 [Gilliamella apicola]
MQIDNGEVYFGKPVNLGQMIPFTITINGKKYKDSWHVDTSYNTSNDTGYWLLVTGYWLLVTGYWLLVTGLIVLIHLIEFA